MKIFIKVVLTVIIAFFMSFTCALVTGETNMLFGFLLAVFYAIISIYLIEKIYINEM